MLLVSWALLLSQVLWVPQVSQVSQPSPMPLVEGEVSRSRLGVVALASGQGGAVVGSVVFACDSWVVSCLEWSPTGIARPVGGWMPQGLETGDLSC